MSGSAADSIHVSVILATLNSAGTLESAIGSVTEQRGVSTETLVVDGASNDQTRQILEELGESVDWFISEPDTGIYQAWNRALKRATGRFVCFLGADDRFADEKALATLVEAANENSDLVSCKALHVTPSGEAGIESGAPYSWEALQRGMVVEHRGLLHRRGLFDEHGLFDESYQIAGDYEFLLRCGPGLQAAHVDQVLVHVGSEGISQERYLLRYRERARAQILHGAQPWAHAWALALSDATRNAYYRLRGRLARP